MILRISHPFQEGVYQASKWVKCQALLDAQEMKDFLEALGNFWIFPVTGFVDGNPISKAFFVEEYSRWMAKLKEGIVPSPEDLRHLMAAVFVDDLESLWLQEVSPNKFITKIAKPIVQVQSHYFSYSSEDGEFRSMSMGKESVFWGLQFSYPQIYQDPKTMEFCEVKGGALYRKIQLWMRENTRATPFLVDGKKVNVPIRLGKQCFSWIHKHPQLIEKKIQVL